MRPRAIAGLSAAYVLVVVGLTAVVTVGARLGEPLAAPPPPVGPEWLDAWFRYDSGWQLDIATHGYSYVPGRQSSVAFFPAFPLAVRAATVLVADPQVAGQLLAWLFGLGALVGFGRWVHRRLPAGTAWLAVALLGLYPYSYYLYGTIYADGMFLCCAIGAFLLVDRRHYVLGGLVAAVATAGRPVGIAVVVGLVVRLLEVEAQARRGGGGGLLPLRELAAQLRLLRPNHLGVTLSLLGLGGWCFYLWRTFGDPLAWIAVQSAPGWDQPAGPRTWLKLAFFGTVARWRTPDVYLVLPQALCAVVVIALLVPILRRFGWGYAAYTLIVVGVPILGTKDFMGCGRYLMLAFPAFAAAAALLAERPAGRRVVPLVLTGLAAGLVAATFFVGWGYEVS